MPTFVGTMFFREGARGFSESWYNTTFNDSAAALDGLNALADVRVKGLGKQSFLQGTRVSDIAIRGDSRVSFARRKYSVSFYQKIKNSDIASSAWYLQATVGEFSRRQVMLRGMPDDWYAVPPGLVDVSQVQPPGRLVTFVAQFRKALIDGTWGLLGQDVGPGRAGLLVLDFDKDNVTNQLILKLQPGAGIPPDPGSSFRLFLPKRFSPALPSVLFAQEVDGFNVTTFTPAPNGLTYTGGSLVRQINKAYLPVSDLQLVRPARRKTGRAFFVPAGRSKKARARP